MKAPIPSLADFAALDPFFRIIEKGLDGLAGPGHFFDLLAEDVTIDYVITAPGYPRRVEGRAAVAELYRPYGTAIILDRCFDLDVHHDAAKGTVVLEYASEGRVVGTGRPYSNQYISVLTLRGRGRALARLPRPGRRVRRARLASTLRSHAGCPLAFTPRPAFSSANTVITTGLLPLRCESESFSIHSKAKERACCKTAGPAPCRPRSSRLIITRFR